jgi:hypothetical protein
VAKCSPFGWALKDVIFDKLRRYLMIYMNSERSFGSPTPRYMAHEFTRCCTFGQRIFGAILLSLTWSLVEHTFMQQIEDESYKLASAKDTRPLMMMCGRLAVFSLVEMSKLIVMHPQRVRCFDKIVSEIFVAATAHWSIIGIELTTLVLFPDNGSELGQSGV